MTQTTTSSAPTKSPRARGAAETGIEIVLNGRARVETVQTLQQLLEAHDYGTTRVATAVNGAFVPASERDAYTLEPGDQIEVVAPRQGG